MNETGASDVRQGVVVVGTDGSKGSVHALRFAFEEALRRGAGAEVITAWTVTSPYTDDYSAPVLDEAHERATAVQDKAVARALHGMDQTPPISPRSSTGTAGVCSSRRHGMPQSWSWGTPNGADWPGPSPDR
jgi:hypothetical protein